MNLAVIELLTKMAGKMTIAETESVLIMDEVSLKRRYTYDIQSETALGYVDLGPEGRLPKPASDAMVFMLQGIYSKWKIPVAFYLTSKDLSGKELEKLTRAVLEAIASTGMKVRVIINDGASKNKMMFKLLGCSEREPYFRFQGRKIYTITDPSHLIKAPRNNFLSHHFISNGVTAQRRHFRDFYERDKTSPARIAPKLTDAHVNPDSYEKMRVKLPAQAMSSSSVAGLFVLTKTGYLPKEAEETAHIFLNFDHLMDSFNGSEPTNPADEDYNKKFRCSITDVSPHQDLWAKLKPWMKSLTFIRISRGARVKSLPFQSSWVRAMTATEMLWLDLKTEGYKHLPTKRLNQDAPENLFSIIRYNGGNSRSPTPETFQYAITSALFNILNSRRGLGNCEEDDSTFLQELSQLLPTASPGEHREGEESREAALLREDDRPSTSAEIEQPDLMSPEVGEALRCIQARNAEELPAYGEAQIAGAAVKKLLTKIDNCHVCSNALVTTKKIPAHATTEFKNSYQNLVYAREALLPLTATIMNIGAKILPELMHQTKVLESFQSLSARCTDFTNLPFCSDHQDLARKFFLAYLWKTSLYKVLHEKNLMLKKRDSMTAMVEARPRRGRHTPLAQVFSNYDDFDEYEELPSDEPNATGSKLTLLPARPPHRPATNSSLREYFSMFDGDE